MHEHRPNLLHAQRIFGAECDAIATAAAFCVIDEGVQQFFQGVSFLDFILIIHLQMNFPKDLSHICDMIQKVSDTHF